ncbi:MAG: hypothetical protein CMP38_01160 [Rickettsiales bacterium]|nr:hypothetical protein [Rickettsiales bacterium]
MVKTNKTLILFSSGDIGGAERSLSRLAYKGKKNEFLLGSLSGDGSILQAKINTNSHVNKFGFIKKSIFHLIISCIKAIIFSKKENIDNLYICGFKACSIIRIISIFIKTPKIIHAIRWNPVSDNINDKIFRIFERIFIFKTTGWVCNSKSALETLVLKCGIPRNKITFIYNGIEINEKIILEKNLNQNVVLTLSNFAPRKGLIEYLSVIEKVVKKLDRVEFIFAGRDDMNGQVHREVSRKQLQKNIKLVGFVNDVSKLFKISKLMVIPSILPEGNPTSILESMSYGKPVIGYDVKGVNELITHNKTGFIIPLLNEKEMANSIVKLIQKPNLANKFGNNSYNLIKKKFTLDAMLEKHREYFNSV